MDALVFVIIGVNDGGDHGTDNGLIGMAEREPDDAAIMGHLDIQMTADD